MVNATSSTQRIHFGENASQANSTLQVGASGVKQCALTLFSIFTSILMAPYKIGWIGVGAFFDWMPERVKNWIRQCTAAFLNLLRSVRESGETWLYRKELRQAVRDFIDKRVPQELINQKISEMPESQQKRFNAEVQAARREERAATEEAIESLKTILEDVEATDGRAVRPDARRSTTDADTFDNRTALGESKRLTHASRVSIASAPVALTALAHAAAVKQTTAKISPSSMTEAERQREIADLEKRVRALQLESAALGRKHKSQWNSSSDG